MRKSWKMSKETLTKELEKLVEGWDAIKISQFQQRFLAWYDEEKRLLPWRINQDAYHVWVSEIMLQQTQVNTVIPYYERFLNWFPTVKDLAEAPEDKLLKAWEGLGYYSRVRNMQVAAKQVMTEFNGVFPSTAKELKTLKGIGPYTSGAIASISFNEVTPAVDGNVMRVFSRLFGIREDIGKPATLKYFDYVVRHVLDPKRPGDMNQATMDLGSAICTPTKPKCESCPLKSFCLAYEQGNVEAYPVKLKKVKVTHKYYLALAIENKQHEFKLIQRPSEGLLANLWTFPLVEIQQEQYELYQTQWKTSQQEKDSSTVTLELDLPENALLDALEEQKLDVVWQKQPVGELTHIFSHLKWHVLVAYGHKNYVDKVAEELENKREAWVSPDLFTDYALPKPQEKINMLLSKKGYWDNPQV